MVVRACRRAAAVAHWRSTFGLQRSAAGSFEMVAPAPHSGGVPCTHPLHGLTSGSSNLKKQNRSSPFTRGTSLSRKLRRWMGCRGGGGDAADGAGAGQGTIVWHVRLGGRGCWDLVGRPTCVRGAASTRPMSTRSIARTAWRVWCYLATMSSCLGLDGAPSTVTRSMRLRQRAVRCDQSQLCARPGQPDGCNAVPHTWMCMRQLGARHSPDFWPSRWQCHPASSRTY